MSDGFLQTHCQTAHFMQIEFLDAHGAHLSERGGLYQLCMMKIWIVCTPKALTAAFRRTAISSNPFSSCFQSKFTYELNAKSTVNFRARVTIEVVIPFFLCLCLVVTNQDQTFSYYIGCLF